MAVSWGEGVQANSEAATGSKMRAIARSKKEAVDATRYANHRR
jgi:hypothetical protein